MCYAQYCCAVALQRTLQPAPASSSLPIASTCIRCCHASMSTALSLDLSIKSMSSRLSMCFQTYIVPKTIVLRYVLGP